MSKKYRNVCRVLNYIEHPHISISTVTGCVSISACASLVGIPIGIANFATGLKVCVITAWIKSISQQLRKIIRNVIKWYR